MVISKLNIRVSDFLKGRLGKKFAGLEIDFGLGPNLIIGPNGSGKSTIFKALRAVLEGSNESLMGSWGSRDFPAGSVEVTLSDGSTLVNQPSFARKIPAGEVRRAIFYDGIADDRARAPMFTYDAVQLQMNAMRSSHGQGLVQQVGFALESAIKHNATLCLDEPDGTLDLGTVAMLSRLDEVHERHGLQSIVISHHPLMLLRALTIGWKVFETERGYALLAAAMMTWPEDVMKQASKAIHLNLPVVCRKMQTKV